MRSPLGISIGRKGGEGGYRPTNAKQVELNRITFCRSRQRNGSKHDGWMPKQTTNAQRASPLASNMI